MQHIQNKCNKHQLSINYTQQNKQTNKFKKGKEIAHWPLNTHTIMNSAN